ncbi:NAD-dependent histone deacetylase HST3 [Smittium mucronatum]|uniref:NAD-dependent histone deacetylase HST3 n=1 Tax=Smittium mucronatum TaxID=133383 RepID=A0A1R0GZX3_9FUNG|nr:NAD-dependent histone deacetylase HST3 [Smittium mucronatum]
MTAVSPENIASTPSIPNMEKSKKTRRVDLKNLKIDKDNNEITGQPKDLEIWWRVQKAISRSKRCIVITGMRFIIHFPFPNNFLISSAYFRTRRWDFCLLRSSNGLFEQLKKKYPKDISSGKDLFDAHLFKDPKLTRLFYSFIGELKNTILTADYTPTHKFIKQMDVDGKLLRCYTQNIDNLEKLVGLETSFLEVEKPVKKRRSSEYKLPNDALLDKKNDSCFVDLGLSGDTPKNQSPNIEEDDSLIPPNDASSPLGISKKPEISLQIKIETHLKGDLSLKSQEPQPCINNETTETNNISQILTNNEEDQDIISNKKRIQKTNLVLDKKFTKAIQLHGSLELVSCTFCNQKYDFTPQIIEKFRNGETVSCPKCSNKDEQRSFKGKRLLGVGLLRPDVVLYNEQHPQSEIIGLLSEYDLRRRPDLLIVMGTSLKIPGVKRLAKEISKTVESSSPFSYKNGAAKSIFINCGPPSSIKEWDNVFDYFVDGPSDLAVEMLKYTVNIDNLPISVLFPPPNLDYVDEASKCQEKFEKAVYDLSSTASTKTNTKIKCSNGYARARSKNYEPLAEEISDSNQNIERSYSSSNLDGSGIIFASRSLEYTDTFYDSLFSDTETLTDICSSDVDNILNEPFEDEVLEFGVVSISTLAGGLQDN